jgi:CelD/BcsL family acetyltransferase involved in cellulose biosynthesis
LISDDGLNLQKLKKPIQMAMEKISTNFNIPSQECNSKSAFEIKYEIIVITDPYTFSSLREEWTELFSKADKPYFTQSYEWNWSCWQKVSEPRGEQLYCLVIRYEGQAVLVWPWVAHRSHYFWSVAHPLAAVSTEYCQVLVDATKDSRALTELALQSIIKTSPFSLMQLYLIRADSFLYPVVASANGALVSTTVAPYLEWENYPNWETYYQKLSRSIRSNVSRRFRRLAELGELRFEILSGNDAFQEELRWLIQTKLHWVEEKNKAWSPFTSSYCDLLSSVIARGKEDGGQLQVCVLKFNDKPIVAELMRIDSARVELVINAYDTDYAMYSPTQIMTKYVLKWAFERHLTVDFRLGDDDNKRTWTTGECEVVSYEICCNNFGKAFVLMRGIYNKSKMYVAGCRANMIRFLKSRRWVKIIATRFLPTQ